MLNFVFIEYTLKLENLGAGWKLRLQIDQAAFTGSATDLGGGGVPGAQALLNFEQQNFFAISIKR